MTSPVHRLALALALGAALLPATASPRTNCLAVPDVMAPGAVIECPPIVPIGVVAPAGGFATGCANRVVLIGRLRDDQGPELLDFPEFARGPCAPRGGSARLECLLAYGQPGLVVGDQVAVWPGMRTGAIRDAFAVRFAEDTDARDDLCFADYRGSGRRVIVVPIILPVPRGGHALATLEGFAGFFVTRQPVDDTLTGEFLYYAAPGAEPVGIR